MGAAAPIALSARIVPPKVGSARRSGPKIQARSAVREENANQESAFAFRGRIPDKSGSRRRNGRRRSIALQVSTGTAAPIARWVTPFVPNGGTTSVSSQASGA